jgi:threonine/homoserine/homoserine lactone efflux protein
VIRRRSALAQNELSEARAKVRLAPRDRGPEVEAVLPEGALVSESVWKTSKLVAVDHLAEFLAVSIIVIVTPGPDTALTIRNTLLGNRRAGVFTALGVVSGQATWALATSAGIAALLVASEPAFTAVKLLGAAYLVFLGSQALFAALRRRPRRGIEGPRRRLPPRVAFRQGVISNLGNPKMAAFFPALLPQFAPAGEAAFPVLLALGLLFCTLTLVWLTAYAVAVARAGDFLRRPSVRRAMEALTGAVLVALGLRLATERR